MSEYGVVTAPRTVRIERLLPGPIERVWDYLVDSEKRGTWLARGELEPRVGGRVEHVFRHADLSDADDPPPAKYADMGPEHRMEGRVVSIEPPRLLAYTWTEEAGQESEVTFELEPRGAAVQLVLTHRRLASRGDMVGVSAGWHAHLSFLEDRLAGRDSTGFWARFNPLEAEYEIRIPAEES